MKLPNGYGNISKLSGNRRNPWRVRKTISIDYYDRKTKKIIDQTCDNFSELSMEILDDGKKRIQVKQTFGTIGYYATRKDAMTALAIYNDDPYDLKMNTLTFSEVYEKWSVKQFETFPSSKGNWQSAYNYCTPLYDIPFKQLTVYHLEETIKNSNATDSTKSKMKGLFNMLYKWAIKYNVVKVDYAQMCDTVNVTTTIVRVPFTDEEVQTLWDNLNYPFVDMVLIGIYSGWRPQELAILKLKDIDLENRTMFGGLKTDAGRNRTVPIHSKIFDLVKARYDQAVELKSNFLFNDNICCKNKNKIELTYDKYRRRFDKVMEEFGFIHKPHDTRHTFVTKAKKAKIEEYIIKLFVGHDISDITEKIYTHRSIDDLKIEMDKIE